MTLFQTDNLSQSIDDIKVKLLHKLVRFEARENTPIEIFVLKNTRTLKAKKRKEERRIIIATTH